METKSNKRKHFTQEKKKSIVKEHYSQGISIPVLARKYGVHAITLYSWKRQMNQKKTESPVSPEYIQKLIEENDKLKGEVQTLKAKVGDLTIKNDILKDIAEVFDVSRSSLYYEPVSQEEIGMPRFYQKSDDQIILEEIKAVIPIRAT